MTRKILTSTSGRGYTLAGCLTARINIDRLWRSLRHLLTADSVKKCVHHKKQPATLLLLVAKIFWFFSVLLTGSSSLETIRRQGVIAFRKNTKKRCAFHDIRKNPRITSGLRGVNRRNPHNTSANRRNARITGDRRIYSSPSSIIWLIIGAAVSTGMANPSPSMPVPEPLATTMPISLPFWSKRPPPEFPGLIAESV